MGHYEHEEDSLKSGKHSGSEGEHHDDSPTNSETDSRDIGTNSDTDASRDANTEEL
eukprot:CAMPEP_0204820950 /NCGR_PEP_ID=MMETSP1018-20131115/214_1 /ASSEMBLY_ACC=CAM_ASM_000518 /TAXON_ID=46462 /ORGANISM="Anophryoides haemophila, Strain AH6" /LENGTH=55 /DNA_ID=CAMNT_0051917441 /DNA_START=568 /DNA_END=735 /DNA_ORIENTATION=-